MPNHVVEIPGLAEIDGHVGALTADAWITVDVAFDSDYWTYIQTNGAAMMEVWEDSFIDNGQSWGTNIASGFKWYAYDFTTEHDWTPAPSGPMQFFRVELHIAAGTPRVVEMWVDGVPAPALTSTEPWTDTSWVYLKGPPAAVPGNAYFDNFKIGTTRGASDVFSDDFEGTLAAWDNFGATIIDDPGITPADVVTPAEGMVGVAFDNGTLDETPTYTWLDLVDGVSIERVEIKRGRPDEHEKTAEGTATITGKDTTGALDPTNPTSPFYDTGAGDTKLNPALQSTVRLQHPISEAWAPIYTGYIDDWDYDLDVSAKFFIWTLTLTDGLAILADAEVIPDNAGDTVPSESVGDVAYDPAPAADRITAALADAALSAGALEWPASKMNIFSLNVHVRGKIYSNGSPLLTVIDDACDAEFPGVANRFFDKEGVFAVRGRLARFDPDSYHPVDNVTRTSSEPILYWKLGDRPAFVADDIVAIISGLKFNRGKDALINAVLATPEGIKDSDIAGQFVKDATSIGKYSARSASFPNLITLAGHDGGGTYNVSANDETKKVGDYYVDNYKTPRSRVRQIVVRTQNPDKPEGGPVWDLLCGVELSDLITPLKTTHPGGGGFDEDFFIEGISYLIVPMKRRYPEVTLTLDVSPRAYFDTNPYA